MDRRLHRPALAHAGGEADAERRREVRGAGIGELGSDAHRPAEAANAEHAARLDAPELLVRRETPGLERPPFASALLLDPGLVQADAVVTVGIAHRDRLADEVSRGELAADPLDIRRE
jgi:hypothetical protein